MHWETRGQCSFSFRYRLPVSFASAEAPRFVCAVEMGRNGVSTPRDDPARAGCGDGSESKILSIPRPFEKPETGKLTLKVWDINGKPR